MDRAGIAREGARERAERARAPKRSYTCTYNDVIQRLRTAGVSNSAFVLYMLVSHGPAPCLHRDHGKGVFELTLPAIMGLMRCSLQTARSLRNELVRHGFWILCRRGVGQTPSLYQFAPSDWWYAQRVEYSTSGVNRLRAGTRGATNWTSEVQPAAPLAGWQATPQFEAAQRRVDEMRAELGLSKMHERYLAAGSPGGEFDRSAPAARPGEAEAEGAYGAAELNGRAKHANGRGDARYARAPRAPDACEGLSEREVVVRQTILAKLRDAAAYIELKQQRHPQWKTLWIDETLIAEATALVRRTSLDRFVDTCAAFVERVERVDTLRAKKSIADGAGYLRSMLRLREGAWPNAHRRTPAGRAKR